MKRITILLMLLFVMLCKLDADVFVSTLAGGWWMDPATWQHPSDYPGADDDVIITGIVFVVGSNSCNNLTIQGADAMLKSGETGSGTLTVYGNLNSTGWVTSSGSYPLTFNLYGNLSIGYHFMPHYFNWRGSGVKTLYCTDSNYGIRSRATTTISHHIEAIQALSDIYFLPGGTSTQVIKADSALVELRLFDPDTRTNYNLTSRSCQLEKLKIIGSGSNVFNFNNDSSLSNVWLFNCELHNLVTTGTHMFETGCSITNIINNGTISNSSSGSRSLYQYGFFTNNGQVRQDPYNYAFSFYSYGDVNNNGFFKPSNFYLRGSSARTLSSSADNPFQANSFMSGEAGLGNVYVGDQLYFANINNLAGPINFKAFTITGQAKTLYFNNVKINSSNLDGVDGSIINGTDLWLQNTPVNNIDLQGNLYFSDSCSLTNVNNYSNLQNSTSSGSVTLPIYGDFENYGTIANHGGYYLTVNAWDDVRNYGTWTAYRLNMYGDDAQEICFGAAHPFAGSYFYDMNSAGSIYVVEEDIYFQCLLMDLNYSTLCLNPGGFDLYLNGTEFIEANIVSDLGNTLFMSNNSRVSSVVFQSITNAGILNLATNTNLNGSLINNGTVQNYGSSVSLSVSGDITNNGTIGNNGGYLFTVNGGGNLINNGIWSNYNTRLNSTAAQMIHFPQEHPYQGSYFYDMNADSYVYSDADLWFEDCLLIDSNYSIWRLDIGNRNLHLDNCYMIETYVHSTIASTLTAINGGYISNCTLQSIILSGTINLASNTSVSGNIINEGVLQNMGSSITLSISGNLTNNGTIRSFGGYNLYINLSGNAINNGTWGNYSLNMNGAADQLLHFPFGHGFTGLVLNDNNVASALIVDCDLYITNTTIDLNNSPLQLFGGFNLWLDNCILIDAPVQSNENSQLSMLNGGYLSSCSFQAITFSGTVSMISNTTISGKLINLGVLQNTGASVNLYVNGDLDNQGQIGIGPGNYSLSLHCGQNILNTGSISCTNFYLTGANPQTLFNSGTLACSSLTDSNAASSLTLLSDLQLNNTSVDLNGATLILNDGSRLGKTLTMQGGYLSEAVVVGGNSSKLVFGNNARLFTVVFDDIIWEGTLLVGPDVSANNLINRAVVKNDSSGQSTLIVNGRLDNEAEGIFQNNLYNFTLRLFGDLYNYGQLKNYEINFRSTENQNIWQSATADTIRCSYFRKSISAGSVTMLSDLIFKNCIISFNAQALIMESGRTSYNMFMRGSYMESVSLVSAAYPTLYMDGGAYIGSGVTCGNIVWDGVVQLSTSTTVNNLQNQGQIMNLSGYYGYLHINGRLDNYGTICNAASYPLDLYCYGDLYDYGAINLRYLYFNGTGTQGIYMSPAAVAITGNSIRKSVASGDLMMLSDLRITNCFITLNNRSLIMSSSGIDHTLYMSGGYMISTYLSSTGNSTLDFAGGAYLNTINGGNLTFRGSMLIYGTCSFGSLVNYAYTRNVINETAHLYVNGNLVNQGTFFSDSYPLYIYVTGNLNNNGALANRRVHITGTTDQNVFLNGTETINHLRLQSNIGSAVWYHNGSPTSNSGSYLDLPMDHVDLYGSWQAYVAASNTWDRVININPAATLDAPSNLQLVQMDGNITVQWNQVSGAIFYKVHYSDNPYSGFSILNDNVVDSNPGDGIVQFSTPGTEQKRIYKITAHN